MIKWRLSHDLRVSEGVSSESLYRIALEQAAWCDARGVTDMWTSEHHGHNEMASPLAFCAAVGAVTKRARLMAGCVLLPLNDPVRVAEDIILADLVSEGRVEVIMGLGYAPQEFLMFGTLSSRRGKDMDEKLPVVLACLEGREFEYRGRHGRVEPAPYQKPRPPILVGGGVAASARRAARLGDGFAPTPMTNAEEVYGIYRADCERLGRKPGPIIIPNEPFFIHVTEDPERDWAIIGPHLLDEINLYGRWSSGGGTPSIGYSSVAEEITDLTVVRQMSSTFAIVTPEQCLALARALPDGSALTTKPLRISPNIDMGWSSLELMVNKVLPRLEVAPPEPAALPQALPHGV